MIGSVKISETEETTFNVLLHTPAHRSLKNYEYTLRSTRVLILKILYYKNVRVSLKFFISTHSVTTIHNSPH